MDFSYRDFVIRRYKFEDTMGIKNGYAKIKRDFDFVKARTVKP